MSFQRKPLSNVRPKREFFVVAAPPSKEFGEYYHFLTVNGHGARNPLSAKRHYSRKSAEAFLVKQAPNPYMGFKVFKMMETRDGISIHTIAYKKNPSNKKTHNKDFFVLGGFFPGRHLPVYLTRENTLDDDSKKARRFASISGAEKLIPKASKKYPSASKWLVFRGKMRDGHLGVYFPPIQSEGAHKKNPAPGLRKRSDRLHKLRLKVLALVRNAEKIGRVSTIDAARKKLLRVDRLISASASNYFSRRAKRRK